MKCLVTGAAGFIGSHLCERLIKDGHVVIGWDDCSTGRARNLISILNHERFFFKDQAYLYNYEIERIDWVFHLAAKADVIPSIEYPQKYHESNVALTLGMLQLARNVGAKRFIYAASSSCYGIPDEYPTPETAECKPMYPYALTKYLGEQYVLHWAKVYKLPAISLRLFNVYGPRARTKGSYGAVMGTFLAQISQGKPVTVVGDGAQSRDFTFVTDVVDAFVRAAESPYSGQVFNISSGRSRTVNELVKNLGAKAVVHIPDRPGEPRQTFGNSTKAYKHLGWTPKVSFDEGCQIMLDHLDDFKNAPLWTPETIAVATKSWFEHLGG